MLDAHMGVPTLYDGQSHIYFFRKGLEHTQPHVTINFKKEIPIGAEVGYFLSYNGLLTISALGTTICGFDQNYHDAGDLRPAGPAGSAGGTAESV